MDGESALSRIRRHTEQNPSKTHDAVHRYRCPQTIVRDVGGIQWTEAGVQGKAVNEIKRVSQEDIGSQRIREIRAGESDVGVRRRNFEVERIHSNRRRTEVRQEHFDGVSRAAGHGY